MVKNCDLCGKAVEKNNKTIKPYRTRSFILKKKPIFQVICQDCDRAPEPQPAPEVKKK